MNLDKYMMATVSGKATSARQEQLSATYDIVTAKETAFIQAVNAEYDWMFKHGHRNSEFHPITQMAFDELMACINDGLVACGARQK